MHDSSDTLSPHDHSDRVASFVLAGGKSSRMGRDKALMTFRGHPLIEIAVVTASVITRDVHIVGDRLDLERFAPVVSDAYRECGPLGGIEAALRISEKEWNLILGVDTPLLPLRLPVRLFQCAVVSKAQITVPRPGDRYQPLCAIYHRSMLAPVQQALKRGDYRVEGIFQSASLYVLDDAELAAAHIPPEAFANLNTLEEFEALANRSGENA